MREIAKRVSLRLDSAEYAHLKQLSTDTGLKMEPVIRRLRHSCALRSASYFRRRECVFLHSGADNPRCVLHHHSLTSSGGNTGGTASMDGNGQKQWAENT